MLDQIELNDIEAIALEAGNTIMEIYNRDFSIEYKDDKSPLTEADLASNEVIIKARGRAISRAVDTAEIVRNRFVTDAEVKNINISTESMTNEEGRTSNVSSIEIYLYKKKGK